MQERWRVGRQRRSSSWASSEKERKIREEREITALSSRLKGCAERGGSFLVQHRHLLEAGANYSSFKTGEEATDLLPARSPLKQKP